MLCTLQVFNQQYSVPKNTLFSKSMWVFIARSMQTTARWIRMEFYKQCQNYSLWFLPCTQALSAKVTRFIKCVHGYGHSAWSGILNNKSFLMAHLKSEHHCFIWRPKVWRWAENMWGDGGWRSGCVGRWRLELVGNVVVNWVCFTALLHLWEELQGLLLLLGGVMTEQVGRRG